MRIALDNWRKNWSRMPSSMKKVSLLALLASALSFTASYILYSSPNLDTPHFVIVEGLFLGAAAIGFYLMWTLSKYGKPLKKYYVIGILLSLVIVVVVIWGVTIFVPK
jgi:cell division protein FtsW (lipid II flippase)